MIAIEIENELVRDEIKQALDWDFIMETYGLQTATELQLRINKINEHNQIYNIFEEMGIDY